jgi:cellulose synthase/poly-beta-1,6-N-acetylglucosamine synthase-like glycosyltransferase
MLIEIILITAILLIVYAYVGYPLLVRILCRLVPRPVIKLPIEPKVSLIIAAYNEEGIIARKLANSFEQDYPPDKLEIIVASDCSIDGTDQIVRSHADRGVLLHRQSVRLGKTVAQNNAIRISTGEVLVFSDATTMYKSNALSRIVRSFADPEVGCVAGQLVYTDDSRTAAGSGCQSYWSYETMIRESESLLGSLIGVSGCFYAVRRSSYVRMACDMSSDFCIASEMRLQGLRTVYEPEAISFETVNTSGRDEFAMRVRIIEQTLSAMHVYRQLLDPRQSGLFAFQLISHKVLRYAVPLLLLIAFLSNALVAGESEIYRILFAAQTGFYALALAGWVWERAGVRPGLAGLPYYFLLANAASVVAFHKFMKGEAHVMWEPLRDNNAEETANSEIKAEGLAR